MADFLWTLVSAISDSADNGNLTRKIHNAIMAISYAMTFVLGFILHH